MPQPRSQSQAPTLAVIGGGQLARMMAQLEGSLEHLLDRVPGLSADDARERAETPTFDRDAPGGDR